jgi:hypothetical protein
LEHVQEAKQERERKRIEKEKFPVTPPPPKKTKKTIIPPET